MDSMGSVDSQVTVGSAAEVRAAGHRLYDEALRSRERLEAKRRQQRDAEALVLFCVYFHVVAKFLYTDRCYPLLVVPNPNCVVGLNPVFLGCVFKGLNWQTRYSHNMYCLNMHPFLLQELSVQRVLNVISSS